MGKIKPYSITGSEVQPSEVISPADTTQLAATEMPGLGSVSGEIDADDIVIPRLNLVQNVGELADLFTPGAVTYNKEVELSDGNTPIEVTVLRARKQFVEALDYDSGERPQVFDSLEEVKAVGGTVEWVGNQKPTYNPVLHVHIVFKAPAGLDYAFPLEYKGESYGMAVWTLRGVAFKRAGRNILTASKFSLRDGLFHGKWELTTKREKVARNSFVVPVLRNVGRNTPDFVEFLRTLG